MFFIDQLSVRRKANLKTVLKILRSTMSPDMIDAELEPDDVLRMPVVQGLLCLGIDDVIRRRHDVAYGADRRRVVQGPTKRNDLCHAFLFSAGLKRPPAWCLIAHGTYASPTACWTHCKAGPLSHALPA